MQTTGSLPDLSDEAQNPGNLYLNVACTAKQRAHDYLQDNTEANRDKDNSVLCFSCMVHYITTFTLFLLLMFWKTCSFHLVSIMTQRYTLMDFASIWKTTIFGIWDNHNYYGSQCTSVQVSLPAFSTVVTPIEGPSLLSAVTNNPYFGAGDQTQVLVTARQAPYPWAAPPSLILSHYEDKKAELQLNSFRLTIQTKETNRKGACGNWRF